VRPLRVKIPTMLFVYVFFNIISENTVIILAFHNKRKVLFNAWYHKSKWKLFLVFPSVVTVN